LSFGPVAGAGVLEETCPPTVRPELLGPVAGPAFSKKHVPQPFALRRCEKIKAHFLPGDFEGAFTLPPLEKIALRPFYEVENLLMKRRKNRNQLIHRF
jgi:hypothetical protein